MFSNFLAFLKAIMSKARDNVSTLNDLVMTSGIFTPGVSFGGGTTGVTYSVQSGNHTRIGRIVVIHGIVTLTAKGSSTGAVLITGLPYNVYADYPVAVVVLGMSGLTGAIKAQAVGGSKTIEVKQSGATGDAVVSDSSCTNTSQFEFALTYSTTDAI